MLNIIPCLDTYHLSLNLTVISTTFYLYIFLETFVLQKKIVFTFSFFKWSKQNWAKDSKIFIDEHDEKCKKIYE